MEPSKVNARFRVSSTNCSVVGCHNSYSNTDKTVKFYRFPSRPHEQERRKQWINAVKRNICDSSQRDAWKPKPHSKICSQHFVNNKKSNHPHSPAFIPKIFPKVYQNTRQKKKKLTSKHYWKNFHTCKLCPYRCKSSFVMCQHESLHDRSLKTDVFTCHSKPPELYPCQFCEFETNLKVDLIEHFLVFHEEKEMTNILKGHHCKNCDFETHSVLVLMKHSHVEVKDAHPTWFQCKQCDFKCKKKNNLKQHILRTHSDPEDINWFKCEECGFKSLFKISLQRHFIVKHAHPADIRWFQCERCEFKCKRKDNLKQHFLLKHTDQKNLNWFQCERCSFRSKFKGEVRRHISRRHVDPENIIWLKCGQCAYSTRYNSDLASHIRVKHGRGAL